MSPIELISLIVNLVFGTGFLVTFFTLKQTRQKAKADVDKSNMDLASQSVKEMISSVNAIMVENHNLIEKQLSLQRTIADNQKRIEMLEKITDESKQMQETMINMGLENSSLRKRIDLLEKKVSCMTKLNREVLKAIEKLGIDDELLQKIKEHSQ